MGESFMSYHPDPLIRDYDDRGMAKWMGGPERQRGICIDKEISFDLTCYFVQ
ncbi:hypothetical protein VL763_14845 [Listeria seeligeri]|uniref:hypothetical protein n=1 Tax=Listeria seeligeri TaxID=1640 RepID=UPI002F40153A